MPLPTFTGTPSLHPQGAGGLQRWRGLLLGVVSLVLTGAAPPIDPMVAHDLAERRRAAAIAEWDHRILKHFKCEATPSALMQLIERHVTGSSDYTKSKGLIERLGADSFEEREEAARRLLASGRCVLAALQRAERHADPEIARRAKECAGRIKTEIRLFEPALRVLLRDPPAGTVRRILAFSDKETRIHCLNELGALGWSGMVNGSSETLRAELRRGLEHEDADTRERVLSALVRNQGTDPLPELRTLTQHRSSEMRRVGICLLGRHTDQPEAVLPHFKRALEDPDVSVRYWATRALRYFGENDGAVLLLLRAMKDRSHSKEGCVAVEATRNLWQARCRTKEVIDTLALVARSPDGLLAPIALDSLSALGRLDADRARLVLAHLTRMTADEDDSLARRGSNAIARMGPWSGPAVPSLVRMFERMEARSMDSARYFCNGVLKIFGLIGPPAAPAVPLLVRVLGDARRPAEDRQEAAAALGQIGPDAKAALPSLHRATKSPEPEIRKQAKLAIALIDRR